MALSLTNYNALVDDSGANADGTFWNKARILDLIRDIDTAYGGNLVTTTAVGTQNDFNIDTIGSTTGGIILCNNASLLTLTGLNNTIGNARYLVLVSIGAGQVDLANQNTGSAAANRIINGVTGTISLAPGSGRCGLIYDTSASRWRVLWHEQGAFIDFSASSTVTGWVSFTTKFLHYKLSGRELKIIFDLSGTSNATGSSFTAPFTAATGPAQIFANALGQTFDNGAQTAAGLAAATVNSTTVNLYKSAATAWTASGTKQATGQIAYEVQ